MKRIRKNKCYYLDENILINDDIVRQYFKKIYESSKKFMYKCLDKRIIEYVNNRFSDSESFKESKYRIEHFLESKPLCKYCGQPLNFTISKLKYPRYCSHQCEGFDISPFKNEQTKEKIKLTLTSRYGSPTYNNRKKFKLTCLERYGVENSTLSKDIQEKIKKTMKERYGVEWAPLNKEIHNRQVETQKRLYGGVFHPEKVLQTNLEKYGCKFYTETLAMIDYNASILEIRNQKAYLTKKKNNSFKSSKPEKDLYEYIKNKFPNVINLYKSKKYPYKCDFYIPELELYIEYNGTWTHGQHPFDENNLEDIDTINLWKSKNTKFYNTAIDVWTKRDVEKRNMAIKNKLNFKELWNINEAKQFIDSLIK